LAFDGLDREDVPGVGGDHVGGDEVDLVAGIWDVVGGEVAAVGVPSLGLGAFDLHANEAALVLDGEIVWGVVAPGFGDAQAEFGGAGHEAQFYPLAARLGVTDDDA